MSAHTPEPWAQKHARVYASDPRDGVLSQVATTEYSAFTWEEEDANAARIVACVNACAGIADPGAALAEVREILTALLPKVEDDASRPGDRWAPLSVRRALALLGAK